MDLTTALSSFLYSTLRVMPERVTQTEFTNDQILAAQATPVELVPAAGAGNIIVPTLVVIESDFAVAYNQNTIEIGYSAASTEVIVSDTDAPNVFQNTGQNVEILPILWLPKLLSLSEVDNMPLLFSLVVGPTGGDAANRMRITTLWRTLALAYAS